MFVAEPGAEGKSGVTCGGEESLSRIRSKVVAIYTDMLVNIVSVLGDPEEVLAASTRSPLDKTTTPGTDRILPATGSRIAFPGLKYS